MPVRTELGSAGQFDVLVGDRLIASKHGGGTRLDPEGFPEPEWVLRRVGDVLEGFGR